ncbi:hypothetical protein G9H65_07945, partial [Cytophagaceae bacterium 50A-KIRBA]|uniref:hypothetical protein n=1 Tax=Aquirufa ecclesiirivi TaxID=2715124 RepID=UPI00140CE958
MSKSQAATQLRLTSTNTTSVAGEYLTVNIEAIDSQGQVDLTYQGTKHVSFSIFEIQLLDYPALVNGSNFGELITVSFNKGKAQVELELFTAGLTTIQASHSGMVSNVFSIQVINGAWNSFQIKLEPNFKNQSPIKGENQILAIDGFGNVVLDFDASKNPVTITSAALDGVISGLGSKGNNVLDQPTDFVDGIADLTALGMIYSGQNINTDILNVSTENGVYVDSEPVEILPQDFDNNYFVLEGLNAVHVGAVYPVRVVAKNILGFTESNYVGRKKLRFGGALTIGIYSPTANGVNFGEEIEVNFVSGIAEVNLILRKAEQASIIVSDSTIASNSPLSVQVISGNFTHFEILGLNKQEAGRVQTLSIREIDIYGNVASSFFSGTKSLIFSGASSTSNPLRNPSISAIDFGQLVQVVFTNGIAQVDLILYQVETASIQVSDGTISEKSAFSIQVKPSSATHFVISGNATQQVGSTQSLIIKAVDAYGNVDTGFMGGFTDVNLVFTGANASNNPVLNPVVKGRYETGAMNQSLRVLFNKGIALVDLTLYKAEKASISVTDGVILPQAPLAIQVKAGSATHNVISGNETQQAGTTQTLRIKAVDAYGNEVIEYTGTKTLTFSGASNTTNPIRNPTVSGVDFGLPVQVVFTNGMAQVDLVLYQLETANIQVSDGSISTKSAFSIQVKSNAATHFVISGTATQQAGATQTLGIKALDDYGNEAIEYSGTKTLIFSGASTTTNQISKPSVSAVDFGQPVQVVFTNGMAQVDLILYQVETANIQVTDGSISAKSAFSIQVISNPATHFVISGTATQQAGSTQSLSIKAVDVYGNGAIEYSGTKTLIFSGASTTTNPISKPSVSGIDFGLPVQVVFTNGMAQVDLILYQVETANIQVSDGSISAKSVFSIQVISNPATHFVISGTATQQAGSTQLLSIKAVDAYGNEAIEYSGAKTLTFSGASTTTNPISKPSVSGIDFGLPVQLVFTNGMAQVDLILYQVETASISVNEGTIKTSSPLAIQVNASSATHFVTSGNATQQVGAIQTLSIKAVDAYGNVDTGFMGGFSDVNLVFSGANASLNPVLNPSVQGRYIKGTFNQGLVVLFNQGVASVDLTLFRAEQASIVVSSGVLASSLLGIQVNASSTTHFVISGQSSQQAGATQTLSIKAVDAYGNDAIEYSGTKTLTFSGASTTANPISKPSVSGIDFGQPVQVVFTNGIAQVDLILYQVETANIQVSVGSISAKSAFSIQVKSNAATHFVISGQSSQQVGATQTLSIKAVDAYGNDAIEYSGTKTLTFSGASTTANPISKP